MFKGSIVALVTPMLGNGDVDYDQLEALINFHVREGTEALVIAGTTGESATLSPDEHCELLQRSYEIIDKRLPLIAGTGANSTSEAIHLTECARKVGAEAALLVCPYYNKPTQRGLFLHHSAIAEAVDIPQILYNVPGRTACDMLPETVQRLASIDNIVGIKEATGDLQRARDILDRCGGEFRLFSGDDATARKLMLQGGHGVISVTANVAPAAMHGMCRAAVGGDRSAAEAADEPISALHRELFVESNPIPVKWALNEMGLIPAGIRLPLTWLSQGARDRVRAALLQAGVIGVSERP